MFHVITYGQKLMPSQASQVRADDRWRLILHVRQLQQRLPVDPPPVDPGKFLAAMGMDKKVVAGQIRLVLLERIGSGRITAEYAPHDLADFLREQFVR